MKEDRSLLILTHLSQLIVLVTGFGNLILPLIHHDCRVHYDYC